MPSRALHTGLTAAPALIWSTNHTCATREYQSFSQMFWPIIARGFHIQAATDVVLDIIDFTTDVDRRMMIIPGNIDNSSFDSFLEKLAFFIALCVLPRVFDNKRNLRVPLHDVLSSMSLLDPRCKVPASSWIYGIYGGL